MIDTQENNELLKRYLDEYHIDTDSEQRSLMLRHLDLVAEKNKVVNLTRIVDAHDAIVRHLVDSLLFMPLISGLSIRADSSFVDIGTGAGFPGIPLGVMCEAHGTLIDSVGKKVRAVEEFISQLGLQGTLEAKSIRAEDLARQQSERYDLVVARAVADLGVLVEYASPLLRRNGSLVVSKGQIAEDEIQRGMKTAALTGMRYVSRETYELPLGAGHREVLLFAKEHKSSVKLPRRTGEAKHNPLA